MDVHHVYPLATCDDIFFLKLLILIIQFNFALSLRIQIAKRLHILMDKVQVVHDVQVYYLNNFLCIEIKAYSQLKTFR